MTEQEKQSYYKTVQSTVSNVIDSIRETTKQSEAKETQARKELKDAIVKGYANDQLVQHRLAAHYKLKQEQLGMLAESPFFTSLRTSKEGSFHIGKFSYSDGSIYSWVSPIAALRFEEPGATSYRSRDGLKKETIIKQKDQVMIKQGKVVFLSTETEDKGRTLVYQDYFSNRKKTSFILPDIVAQMEKSQDQVIRASVKGPLVISGPAGSGKTTLALHRVAYLLQSPNLAKHFRARDVIVFVQDVGTKEYFAGLLPELGIHDVTIITFAEWAMNILDIEATYETRIGNNEQERNQYSHAKISALRQTLQSTKKRPFDQLEEIYASCFSNRQQELFAMQREENILDRTDVTILLSLFQQVHGTFTANREYYEVKKDHSAIKKVGRFPLKYTLMIFDEFQNYLPEQITLAKSTLDDHFDAAMYIGDMNQQTWLGTIQEWDDINETIKDDRHIELHSVYRNTKSILRYIQSRGYNISIDDRLPEGEAVEVIESKEIVASINELLPSDNTAVGIIGMNPESLAPLQTAFQSRSNLHVLTAHEAQGVEFDTVFFIDTKQTEDTYSNSALQKEVAQVEKDLLYVALTRAMNTLVVLY